MITGQIQSVQEKAADRPPIEFRVVTERPYAHHVFVVFDSSSWWQWRASYGTREEADEHARRCSPDHNTIWVNLSRNEVKINGGSVKVTPKQAELLSLFVDRFGKPMTGDRIVDRIWNDHEYHNIRPHISNMRKLLAMTPFEIINSRARGYALVERKPAKEVLR